MSIPFLVEHKQRGYKKELVTHGLLNQVLPNHNEPKNLEEVVWWKTTRVRPILMINGNWDVQDPNVHCLVRIPSPNSINPFKNSALHAILQGFGSNQFGS